MQKRLAYQFEISIDELLTNTISYGFPDGTGEPPHVALSVAIEEDALAICVEDNGVAFDPFTQAPAPHLELEPLDMPVGGLGVHIVKSMVEETHYERRNGLNRIVLRSPIHDGTDGQG